MERATGRVARGHPRRSASVPRRGPWVISAAVAANLLLWLLLTPPNDGRDQYVRQIVGEVVASTVVILFAAVLLLATRARFLEPHFGGLDRMYRAHRIAGQTGMVLLIVHVALTPWRLAPGGGVPAGLIAFAGFTVLVALSVAPRLPVLSAVITISYRTWRHTHRFIGLFMIMSAAHMALVSPLASRSRPLLVVLIAAFAIGTGSYLYTLPIARFVRRTYAYRVAEVNALASDTVEIVLRPRRRRTSNLRGRAVRLRQVPRMRAPRAAPVHGQQCTGRRGSPCDDQSGRRLHLTSSRPTRAGPEGDRRRQLRHARLPPRIVAAGLDRRRNRCHTVPELAAIP